MEKGNQVQEKEKSFNLTVIEAKEKIMKAIVECKLPVTVAQLVIMEIKQSIDIQATQIIQRERAEQTKIINLPADKNKGGK